MTVEQMREAISDVYISDMWKRKVSNMPEDQVMAIYFNFKEKGYLEQPPRDRKPPKEVAREPVQLGMYDFLKGERFFVK